MVYVSIKQVASIGDFDWHRAVVALLEDTDCDLSASRHYTNPIAGIDRWTIYIYIYIYERPRSALHMVAPRG